MQPILTDSQRHLLRIIFDRGAEGASKALSKWLAEEVHLAISEVELVELDQAAELLGPADSLVAACTMGLTGRLTGLILLVFEDRSGFALVDLLMHQPVGTTTTWGELEQSGRQGDDQHCRLRLCQCPGISPTRHRLDVLGLGQCAPKSGGELGAHATDIRPRIRR